MHGMIERWIIEILRTNITQIPVVVLLGARQVGKTTLARTFAKRIGFNLS